MHVFKRNFSNSSPLFSRDGVTDFSFICQNKNWTWREKENGRKTCILNRKIEFARVEVWRKRLKKHHVVTYFVFSDYNNRNNDKKLIIIFTLKCIFGEKSMYPSYRHLIYNKVQCHFTFPYSPLHEEMLLLIYKRNSVPCITSLLARRFILYNYVYLCYVWAF